MESILFILERRDHRVDWASDNLMVVKIKRLFGYVESEGRSYI